MQIINAVNPTDEQLEEFFGAGEDGPFVMVNLLKFKEKAEYEDGSDSDLSGAEAYSRYGTRVLEMLEKVGGAPLFGGAFTGLMIGQMEENWDMIALVQYPSLAAFQKLISSPEYEAITHHRTAGLAGQLNIKAKAAG